MLPPLFPGAPIMSTNTPNRIAIYQLADFIASESYSFDMEEAASHVECGSAGCIGGHAGVLWPELRPPGTCTWIDSMLAVKLRISEEQHDLLCYPEDEIGIKHSWITRGTAVRCLRRLAETGKVDWHYALKER